MRRQKFLALSVSVLTVGFMLQGCEQIVHSESKLSTSKLQLEEDVFQEDVAVEQMDDAYIASLAQHYAQQGDGAVELTVTYDPKSKTKTAMHAGQHIARISKAFRKNGVENVNTMILPVKGQGDNSRAIVSYSSYELTVPDDCTMMSGYSDRNVDPQEDYKLGCTRDSILAKQIARPKDMGGQTKDWKTSDGRRAANIVDRYRTGEPNPELGGESASE